MAEQLLRLMHFCGMPAADADLVHGAGAVVGEIIAAAEPRSVQFTGSARVAEHLAAQTRGKARSRLPACPFAPPSLSIAAAPAAAPTLPAYVNLTSKHLYLQNPSSKPLDPHPRAGLPGGRRL